MEKESRIALAAPFHITSTPGEKDMHPLQWITLAEGERDQLRRNMSKNQNPEQLPNPKYC